MGRDANGSPIHATRGQKPGPVRGMVKNRHLARSVADMGFFESRGEGDFLSLQ